MSKRNWILSGAVLTALFTLLPAAPLSAAEPGLMTDCTVLVGYAENGGPQVGVTLIVPGTLIPALESNQWPTDMSSLQEQLKNAYRLKKMRVACRFSKPLEVGTPGKLPTTDGIEATLTLVGHNDSVATYLAEMKLDGQSLASASLSVSLGGRAVMGSRLDNADYDDPYVFLVVEAMHPEQGENAYRRAGEDGCTIPRVIERVDPKYPEEARKAELFGKVILEVLVDVDGSCRVGKTHKSPDEMFTVAATEAVEQWKCEPGLDPQGTPVKMSMTLVIEFALK